MAGIADIVSGIFKPITDIVDHLTVSGDQKAAIQLAIVQGQINAAASATNYEQQLLDAQGKVVLAEANGSGFLQRNWRPITMLTFLVLVVCDSFGWLPNKLAPQAWNLLQYGITGYVVGRSAEKIAAPLVPAIVAAIKGK